MNAMMLYFVRHDNEEERSLKILTWEKLKIYLCFENKTTIL